MASKKNPLRKLRASYKKAQESNSIKLFLLNLFDLVEEYNANHVFSSVDQLIDDEKTAVDGVLFQELDFAFEFLGLIRGELEKYSKKQKVCVDKYLVRFDAVGSDKPSLKGDYCGSMVCERYGILQETFAYLLGLDSLHEPFVSRFIHLELDRESSEINIALGEQDYKSWRSKAFHLKNCHQGKVYSCRKRLLWLYSVYKNYPALVEEYRSISGDFGVGLIESWHKKIMVGLNPIVFGGSCDRGLELNDLKYDLAKFYSFVEDNLISSEKSEKKLVYNSELGELIIHGHLVKISRKRFAHEILPIIDKYQGEPISWCVVYKGIEYKEPARKNAKFQRKLYDAYAYINKECFHQTKGKVKRAFRFGLKQCEVV